MADETLAEASMSEPVPASPREAAGVISARSHACAARSHALTAHAHFFNFERGADAAIHPCLQRHPRTHTHTHEMD